jgi:hypothetical protein
MQWVNGQITADRQLSGELSWEGEAPVTASRAYDTNSYTYLFILPK